MTKINRFFKLNILAVLLIGFLTVGVYSADFQQVADEMIGSSGITWVPKVNYSQLGLTISRPDGTVFSKTFDSGSSLYASLSEIFGDSYRDGSYNYELRVTPVTENQSLFNEINRSSVQSREALTQSGSFFVQGGAIVNNDVLEPGSEAAAGSISGAQEGLSGVQDIQHLDDVIITFSLCVGNDCVNGENFGFDTIRLKENNLRIHFDDTSNSASFPSNDWRISINDSNNGGASYFRVEDATNNKVPFTIEANTPNNTLYVDSAGRIGIGTSTPVVDIHAVSGNTPTLRLEQDGSSGFTAQTWDVAGNEANFFVRDVNHGSHLVFRIKPSAPGDSLFIAADGDVGMNTDSPQASLHVKRATGTASDLFMLENDGPTRFVFKNTSSSEIWRFNAAANGLRIAEENSGVTAFSLTATGDLTINGSLTTTNNTGLYPDYVFESSYNLLSLEELAEYIKKEGHLPNIPKAEEAREKGVNITELQMKLLEKVEELTLYTLSQEYTIKELKKEIRQLKNNK